MPDKIISTTVSTIYEYLKFVDKLTNSWGYPSGFVWYRGVKDSRLSLVPGTVWRGIKDEDNILAEFLINYKNLNSHAVKDEWEIYTLMQHYRLPTRLLDWSKSPLVALYFALEEKISRGKRCVWVMDPSMLNTVYSQSGIIVPRDVEYIGDIRLIDYLPESLKKEKGNPGRKPKEQLYPIAIEPSLSNQRILNQQGCFTIHPSGYNTSLEELFESSGEKDGLQKIIVKNESSAKAMLKSLYNYGIREEIIYQDMDTLSKRIIRERIGV